MNLLHYLVEANIYLGVFYLCYCLFLNNETHYTLSRAYLLFSCVVAFVLPVTQLSILKPVVPVVTVQPIYTGQVSMALPQFTAQAALPVAAPALSAQDFMIYVYLFGALIALAVFFLRLYKLSVLTRNSKALYQDRYMLVKLNGDNTAFSFFNYLFIGTEIPQSDTIIAHELVHIRQKHSVDIVFLELLKVVNWFNPFVYLVQRSLKTVHEYIADEQTAAHEQDAIAYSSFLLNNAYGIQGSPIAHSFFNYNLLKKRIIMLNQKRSGRLARLKYLAAVPLCAGMLCASTLVFSKDYAFIDLTPKRSVVEEPVMVKRLKIINDGIIMYSDNVSVKEKDGSSTRFDVKTITAADIKYLLTEHKLKVEVIEVDAAKNPNNPKVIFPDKSSANSDTTFAIKPQPIYGKDYILQESGYLIDKEKEYYTVSITDKAGNEKTYNSSTATEADLKMLMDNYNFKFTNYHLKAMLAMNAAPTPQSKHSKMPPPAPPIFIKTPFYLLSNFVSQHAVYPKAAFKENILASIITTIKLNDDGKITDVIFEKKDTYGFSDALEKTLLAYNYPIKEKAGTYKFRMAFNLLGHIPPPVSADIQNDPAYIGEMGTVGLTAQQRAKLMAPPPPRPKIKDQIKLPPPPPKRNKKLPPMPPPPPVTAPGEPAGTPVEPKVGMAPNAGGRHLSIYNVDKTGSTLIVPPPAPGSNKGDKLQPPAPYDPAYVALYQHISETLRYPDAAKAARTTGNVILSYTVGNDHKISRINVIKGIGNGCDDAAVAALENFKGSINKPAGEYFIATIFALKGYTKSYQPFDDYRFKPNFAGVAITLGELNSAKMIGALKPSAEIDLNGPIMDNIHGTKF